MPAIPIRPAASAPHLESSIRSLLPRISTTAAQLLRRIPLKSLHSASTPKLDSRAVAGIIPTYYKQGGPTPGTTAGIVLGSIAGFLFIIWLFSALFGNNMFAVAGEEEVVVRRRNSPGHSRRSRRSTRTEVREVSRSPRRERVVVEERRERPRPRSVIVEERVRVPGDDIVEVIEEEDIRPPRRGSGRRGSNYGY